MLAGIAYPLIVGETVGATPQRSEHKMNTIGNATVKANGARVWIIDTDAERHMYRVRHTNGGVGWGRMDAITPDKNVTINNAANGDELLTALATIKPENRYYALAVCGVKILREAADLCGVDSTDLGKKAAIRAIVQNF